MKRRTEGVGNRVLAVGRGALRLAVCAGALWAGAAGATEDEVKGGAAPVAAKPDAPLSERDLTALLKRAGAKPEVGAPGAKPAGPVTRVRVVVAFVKLAFAPETVEAYRADPPPALPPDMDRAPLWARPYVAAAVDAGWLPANAGDSARDPGLRRGASGARDGRRGQSRGGQAGRRGGGFHGAVGGGGRHGRAAGYESAHPGRGRGGRLP